jgi:hypothetical protein
LLALPAIALGLVATPGTAIPTISAALAAIVTSPTVVAKTAGISHCRRNISAA